MKILFGGNEDVGGGIQPHKLRGPLLNQMIGNDKERRLEKRLADLSARYKKDSVVTFEQLGVDRMFVAEGYSRINSEAHC